VVDLVRNGFAFATQRRTMPSLRGGRLRKIILFGGRLPAQEAHGRRRVRKLRLGRIRSTGFGRGRK
jgi:hypothetical protein